MAGLATPLGAGAFALLSIAAWLAAHRFAVAIFGKTGDSMLLTGILAGLLGAFLLAAGMAVLFSEFRRPQPLLLTTLVGGVAGALLGLSEVIDHPLVLFPAWQGLVAASLATAFEPPGRSG